MGGGVASLAANARMLQFASQALPTGAFAYSGGLESAVELGMIAGEADGTDFLRSLLEGPVSHVELPLFARMYDAFFVQDFARASRLSAFLLASRESSELQEQDAQMGRSLRRVLVDLWGSILPSDFTPRTFAEGLALCCVHYEISRDEAVLLYGFTWLEQHATALARLLPLGPLASQRVVDALARVLPTSVDLAARLPDERVGMTAPGLSLMSSLHETQYSRVFRS